MQPLELDDIQGLLAKGYKSLEKAAYFLVAFADVAAARAWLGAQLSAGAIDSARRGGPSRERNLAVALTASGLAKLGLDEGALRTLVPELREGVFAHARARQLGDTGANDSAHWRWGGADDPIDLLVVAFAAKHTEAWRTDVGKTLCAIGSVRRIDADYSDVEPFGFRDGISQPFVEGLTRGAAPARARVVRAGEFVLGYLNEAGQLPAAPSLAATADPARVLPRLPNGRCDLGRNGSFLVLRQIEQDVDKFCALTARDPRLAAQLVGRWPSGAPVTRHPVADPGVAANDFGYRDDRHGLRCPVGAHVRRANPRDSLWSESATPDEALALADQHRILRRGRVYCEGGQKGLMFLCLNANIEKQFEFVQASWIANPEFDGLDGERDALLGPGGAFTQPGPFLSQRVTGLAQFTTLRGGAYFFLPGLRALRYLAAA